MLKGVNPAVAVNSTVIFSNVTTAANATFATSTLALAPKGYIILTVNGTNQKIPYYDV
jgi:hypothetical protein